MNIGIVGEIASGKSTVGKILEKHKDYLYIDVDKIAHYVIEPNGKAYNEVINYFGNDILNEDKTIDREKLGEIVFSNPEKLQKLNEITHKYIYSEVRSIFNRLRYQFMFQVELNVILDTALLYEIRLDSLVDEVWYIDAAKEIRLQRLMQRNNYTEAKALKRIEAQDVSKHKSKADRIIINNGSKEELEEKILKIIN